MDMTELDNVGHRRSKRANDEGQANNAISCPRARVAARQPPSVAPNSQGRQASADVDLGICPSTNASVRHQRQPQQRHWPPSMPSGQDQIDRLLHPSQHPHPLLQPAVPKFAAASAADSAGIFPGRDDDISDFYMTPCRARGMPNDHNFKTANFVIPPDIQHGQYLICSHQACRNAGIKFRYCAPCQLPVAKRNFRNRHGHGNEHVSIKINGALTAATPSADDQQPPNGMNDAPPTNSDNADGKPRALGSAGSQSIEIDDHNGTKLAAVAVAKPARAVTSSSGEGGVDESALDRYGGSEGTTNSDDVREGETTSETASSDQKQEPTSSDSNRQTAWVNLLARRPASDQEDAMSAWLMEVMAVSDKKHSALPPPSSSSSSSNSASQQKSSSSSTSSDRPRKHERPRQQGADGVLDDDSNCYYSSLTDSSPNECVWDSRRSGGKRKHPTKETAARSKKKSKAS